MKILKVEIYSPEHEKLREVEFNENGLSVIYGEVEKPKDNNETSNSIGKTVLLKIINIILGANNSGKDTIKGLEDYIIKAVVKYKDINYDVDIVIGDSKSYHINDEKYQFAKYKEFFNLNRLMYNKQINLDKRKGLISSIAKTPNKDDISAILRLLYLDDIQLIFKKIKKLQENIELINKYNNNYKDDMSALEKEKFTYEMKKKQLDDEINSLNNRIQDLKISKDIDDISIKRSNLDYSIKDKREKYQINDRKIAKYEEVINDSNNEITFDEVKRVYNSAKVEIPEMIKKELTEIELFYDDLIKDKNEIYINQIAELKAKNKTLINEIKNESLELDELSKIIAENDSFKEAIKIYDNKSKEKLNIETKISEITGKLSQINSTKEIKGNIDKYYIDLNEKFDLYNSKINSYREFIYNIVEKIYGDERNPYLSINIADGSYKYKALPVKIELSIDGDSGEGIGAAKYLLFDYLIMNYNKYIDILIEDSACFEGIDRRQIANILKEGIELSTNNNKQFIVSLNKYLINNYDDIKEYIVIKLSESDTLLNRKF